MLTTPKIAAKLNQPNHHHIDHEQIAQRVKITSVDDFIKYAVDYAADSNKEHRETSEYLAWWFVSHSPEAGLEMLGELNIINNPYHIPLLLAETFNAWREQLKTSPTSTPLGKTNLMFFALVYTFRNYLKEDYALKTYMSMKKSGVRLSRLLDKRLTNAIIDFRGSCSLFEAPKLSTWWNKTNAALRNKSPLRFQNYKHLVNAMINYHYHQIHINAVTNYLTEKYGRQIKNKRVSAKEEKTIPALAPLIYKKANKSIFNPPSNSLQLSENHRFSDEGSSDDDNPMTKLFSRDCSIRS